MSQECARTLLHSLEIAQAFRRVQHRARNPCKAKSHGARYMEMLISSCAREWLTGGPQVSWLLCGTNLVSIKVLAYAVSQRLHDIRVRRSSALGKHLIGARLASHKTSSIAWIQGYHTRNAVKGRIMSSAGWPGTYDNRERIHSAHLQRSSICSRALPRMPLVMPLPS